MIWDLYLIGACVAAIACYDKEQNPSMLFVSSFIWPIMVPIGVFKYLKNT